VHDGSRRYRRLVSAGDLRGRRYFQKPVFYTLLPFYDNGNVGKPANTDNTFAVQILIDPFPGHITDEFAGSIVVKHTTGVAVWQIHIVGHDFVSLALFEPEQILLTHYAFCVRNCRGPYSDK
jgi:hypothetical protein